MKTLFVTPIWVMGDTWSSCCTESNVCALGAYAREQGTVQPEVLDCKALEILGI